MHCNYNVALRFCWVYKYWRTSKYVNQSICITNSHTIHRRITAMKLKQNMKALALLRTRKGEESLISDAWSSGTYRGYMTVTAHWTNLNWKKQSAIVEIQRFKTLHTIDTALITYKRLFMNENWLMIREQLQRTMIWIWICKLIFSITVSASVCLGRIEIYLSFICAV